MIEGWGEPTPIFCSKHPEWYFDVEEMRRCLNEIIDEINYQNSDSPIGLKGIAIQSQNGEYTDGFKGNLTMQYPDYMDQDTYDPDPKLWTILEVVKQQGLYHPLDYVKPTIAYRGIFKDIIEFFESKGIHTSRARLSVRPPKDSLKKHSDGNFFRIHIPIDTGNFKMCWDDRASSGKQSFELGCVYLCNVHRYHYTENDSTDPRWHLIIDAWDTGNNFEIGYVTPERWQNECDNAKIWRDYVDGISNAPDMILIGARNRK
jgi:hypothetical protein